MENLQCETERSNFDFENNQHPLLINTVLREIFKNTNTADLKNFRLVCKDWNSEAFRLLKKIEWKSPILFETIDHLHSFLKIFGPCPQNILNRNLDCGQILVPSDKEPEIFFHKILPIMSCITELKVNINIQQERTFVAHEAFQPLAQTLEKFDVRFIKNDNISLTPHTVYPPTQLPSLPTLTSVIIRMDGFVRYKRKLDPFMTHDKESDNFVKYGNRLVHHEYARGQQLRPGGFAVFDSEYKMLIELIQELVLKSPLLSEIHLVRSNSVVDTTSYRKLHKDSFEHKSIRILTNLKRNELEKITHLRFAINNGEDIPYLLKLAKSGLNNLKYIYIDYVFVPGGMDETRKENLLEMLECQKETLEYFKVNNFSDGEPNSQRDTLSLPPMLPKLKVLKLPSVHLYTPLPNYRMNMLDLNSRFPNLKEIDLTGGGYRSFLYHLITNTGPLIPCIQIKKLHLDNQSFLEFRDTQRRLSEYFPNITEVKYHMADIMDTDVVGCSELWTMTCVEHLVLKVPLYTSNLMCFAVFKPFSFIPGGINDLQRDQPELELPRILQARMKRLPNITWLTGLKSLKIKQRRRYGCPEARIESGRPCDYTFIENLGLNILSNMPNLNHFSSDLHCFSKESIAQLKMKIPHFEPGTNIDQVPLFR